MNTENGFFFNFLFFIFILFAPRLHGRLDHTLNTQRPPIRGERWQSPAGRPTLYVLYIRGGPTSKRGGGGGGGGVDGSIKTLWPVSSAFYYTHGGVVHAVRRSHADCTHGVAAAATATPPLLDGYSRD